MFETLQQAQERSQQDVFNLISHATLQGKEKFYILEALQTTGVGRNLKYRLIVQGLDKFNKKELNLLGFSTMLTHFTRSPDSKKYITTTLYHVLDRKNVEIIHNMKESAFIEFVQFYKNDKGMAIMLMSTRKHAKRLLNGKK